MVIVDDLTKLSFHDGLSRKNTILTFRLAEWQLKLLCETIERITDCKIKVFVTDDLINIYAIPNFMAFINFVGVSKDDKEGYLEFLQECLEPFELDGEIIEPGMPVTYIFDHDLTNLRLPNVMVNSDIFIACDKLRLVLLQEIKKLEGCGQACENLCT